MAESIGRNEAPMPSRAAAAAPALGRGSDLWYFVLSHLSLAVAAGLVAWKPSALAGFFYQPHLLGLAHWVALGWVGSSILGALRALAPRVLRIEMPARRGDGWAFWLWALGFSGLASHMELVEPYGLAGSALFVLLGGGWTIVRFERALGGGRIGAGVRLTLRLAGLNFFLAAAFGTLLGLDKLKDLVPGDPVDLVVAHAHLAALGWVGLTSFAFADRMLPMLFPSAAPEGRGVPLALAAIAVEFGVVGIAWQVARDRPVVVPAVAAALGVAIFLGRVAWMLAKARRPGPSRFRPNLARTQALAALVALAAALVLGLSEARPGWSERELTIAIAYGLLGVLGFFGQLVAAVAGELLPTEVWIRRFGQLVPEAPLPPPIAWVHPFWRFVAFFGWTLAVPCLALGSALRNTPLLTVGAVALCLAALGQGLAFARLFVARPRG